MMYTGSRRHVPSRRLQESLCGTVTMLDLQIGNDITVALDVSSGSLTNLVEGILCLHAVIALLNIHAHVHTVHVPYLTNVFYKRTNECR